MLIKCSSLLGVVQLCSTLLRKFLNAGLIIQYKIIFEGEKDCLRNMRIRLCASTTDTGMYYCNTRCRFGARSNEKIFQQKQDYRQDLDLYIFFSLLFIFSLAGGVFQLEALFSSKDLLLKI